jgi:hypothetical protein
MTIPSRFTSSATTVAYKGVWESDNSGPINLRLSRDESTSSHGTKSAYGETYMYISALVSYMSVKKKQGK